MSDKEMIQMVLTWLAELRTCPQCATRIRFGDYECPHCGADLEDVLREWALGLVRALKPKNV